jgi:hypothetical protein
MQLGVLRFGLLQLKKYYSKFDVAVVAPLD